MNYISSEEFLKQSEKVQGELIRWWKPQIGDLFCDINAYKVPFLDCIFNEDKKEIVTVDKKYNYFIPLLQMHQLIQFIEETTKKDLSHWRDIDNNEFTIYLTNKKFDEEFQGYTIINQEKFSNLGNDLLEALWKVTIQIVEETEE